MELKKLEDEPIKEEIVKTLDFNYHIQSISKIKKEICEELIRDNKGEHYFDETFNGKCYITYPLESVVEFEIKDCNTIGSLLWQISQAYKQIYKEESQTTKIKPGYIKGMLNRNNTNGNYGIWGHVFGDLHFERIEIDKNNNTFLCIGS